MDCEWGAWVTGKCSKECGGGSLTNTRTRKVDAGRGGKECSGSPSMVQSCNNQKCSGTSILTKCIASLIWNYHMMNLIIFRTN